MVIAFADIPPKIDEIRDVSITSIADANILKYESSTQTWKNAFIADSEVTFTDITTNNASTSAHGYLPKLSGSSTQFLNGTGAFSTPSGIVNSYTSQAFSSQTSVNVTHNFGVYPLVQVINGSGVVVLPLDITHNTVNDFTVTFTSSTSGTIVATVGSPGASNVTTTSVNYTTTGTDKYIVADTSGITITMFSSPGTGLEQEVKNTSNGSITVASSNNIDGNASVLVASEDNLALFYNGSEWSIR